MGKTFHHFPNNKQNNQVPNIYTENNSKLRRNRRKKEGKFIHFKCNIFQIINPTFRTFDKAICKHTWGDYLEEIHQCFSTYLQSLEQTKGMSQDYVTYFWNFGRKKNPSFWGSSLPSILLHLPLLTIYPLRNL